MTIIKMDTTIVVSIIIMMLPFSASAAFFAQQEPVSVQGADTETALKFFVSEKFFITMPAPFRKFFVCFLFVSENFVIA